MSLEISYLPNQFLWQDNRLRVDMGSMVELVQE